MSPQRPAVIGLWALCLRAWGGIALPNPLAALAGVGSPSFLVLRVVSMAGGAGVTWTSCSPAAPCH